MYQHTSNIPLGEKGQLSKINEEFEELKDAHAYSAGLCVNTIECADIIEAVGQFSMKNYKAPLCLIIVLCYLRKIYKPIRNKALDLIGLPKTFFFKK